MKSSPVYPKYETVDYNGHEFDPQVDFAQVCYVFLLLFFLEPRRY